MNEVLFPRLSDDHLGSKMLLGIVLMFIPIVNLFSFGYLYRFLKTPLRNADGSLQLPQWNDWGHLFMDGIRLLLFLMAYVTGGALIAMAISLVLFLASFGCLRAHWPYFFRLLLIALMPLLLVHLQQYQRGERIRDLLKFRPVLQNFSRIWSIMLLPALAVLGLEAACGIFYGLSWFIGLGMFFAVALNIENAAKGKTTLARGNSSPHIASPRRIRSAAAKEAHQPATSIIK